jgi:hypothetical protein
MGRVALWNPPPKRIGFRNGRPRYPLPRCSEAVPRTSPSWRNLAPPLVKGAGGERCWRLGPSTWTTHAMACKCGRARQFPDEPAIGAAMTGGHNSSVPMRSTPNSPGLAGGTARRPALTQLGAAAITPAAAAQAGLWRGAELDRFLLQPTGIFNRPCPLRIHSHGSPAPPRTPVVTMLSSSSRALGALASIG